MYQILPGELVLKQRDCRVYCFLQSMGRNAEDGYGLSSIEYERKTVSVKGHFPGYSILRLLRGSVPHSLPSLRGGCSSPNTSSCPVGNQPC